jgi:hypothetical protein
MFNTLYVRLAIIAIVVSSVIGLGYTAYNNFRDNIFTEGANSVQVKWDAVETERSKVVAEEKTKKALADLAMKNESEAQMRLLNEKNKSLNATVATITRELRNRPDRPTNPGTTNLPSNPTTEPATGSTGKELYRADAEFLIGEAARAEKLIILLESCKAQYNSVYQEYLKLHNGN